MGAPGSSNLRLRLLALAERRLPALTRQRRPEALPINLDRRRIYVLPTRFGLLFALLLAVMLLGALNYGNNPALLLTCLFGAAGGASLFFGFRILSGLRLTQLRADPGHAGLPLGLHPTFTGGARDRPALRLRLGDVETQLRVPANASAEATLDPVVPRRGWFHPGPLRVATDYPLGLFHFWSWVHPNARCLVYPALESPPPALPAGAGAEGERARHGNNEEHAGLRGYRSGDAPRLIAWKASARHDRLLVREPEFHGGATLVFDYASLASLDVEARISRLAAWVVAAEMARASYTLRLPDAVIGPGLGPAQQADCLRALALLPGPGRA